MNFNHLANKTILDISDNIEKKDINHLIDIEYEEEVLKLTTPQGIYIINKNAYSEEIWLSSPLSGAYHFKYNQENQQWKNNKKISLHEVLYKEIIKIITI